MTWPHYDEDTFWKRAGRWLGQQKPGRNPKLQTQAGKVSQLEFISLSLTQTASAHKSLKLFLGIAGATVAGFAGVMLDRWDSSPGGLVPQATADQERGDRLLPPDRFLVAQLSRKQLAAPEPGEQRVLIWRNPKHCTTALQLEISDASQVPARTKRVSLEGYGGNQILFADSGDGPGPWEIRWSVESIKRAPDCVEAHGPDAAVTQQLWAIKERRF
jgi:hypothetical protein